LAYWVYVFLCWVLILMCMKYDCLRMMTIDWFLFFCRGS
jgi:hypothetical protein